MRYLNSVLGTLNGCPYAPREKCDPVSLGAAGIMAGASVLGNILGFGSSSSANSTNIKIAEMNNKAQWDMMKAQQAYNEEMWNKQNEYNSPINQTQRLLAAGINPSTVFGNGSVSEAGQLTAPQIPSLQQAHVNPFIPDLSGVGQAANAYFQNQLLSKNAESAGVDTAVKRIDLQFKVQNMLLNMKEQIVRIDESLSRKNLNDQERDNLISQRRDLDNRVKLFEENFEELSKREKLQNDIMENQSKNLIADTTLKRASANFSNLQAAWFPKMSQAQLNVMASQCQNIIAQTALLVEEKNLTNRKIIAQTLENRLLKVTAEHKEFNWKNINRNEYTRELKGFSDYVSGLILDNLKIFGK